MVRLMTAWPDLVVGDLVGGISQVLGTEPPLAPPNNPASDDAELREMLRPDQRAMLTYMGIDPQTASIAEINKALTGMGQEPLAPKQAPPHAPASGEPPPPAPNPDGPTLPADAPATEDGLSGAAAEAAKRLDAALEKNRTAINEADEQLAEAILKAKASSEQGQAKLKDLQQSIIDQVEKIGPTLDTPAGQQQLADFLQGKISEIIDVLKTAGLDSTSHSAMLDGLTARYDALTGEKTGQGNQTGSETGLTGTPLGEAPPAGGGGETGADGGAGLTGDPMLDSLASDPLLTGLGSMLGPGMGALGSLPGMLGGMMPFGGGGGGMPGGGLPLGDIGSGLGSAIRDATHAGDPGAEDPDSALEDPAAGDKHGLDQQSDDPAALKDPPAGDPSETNPAGTQGANAPSEQVAAEGGKVDPPQQAPADTTVKLPSGATVNADNAALAKAGRAVLEGTPVEDAYRQAGINLSPPGAPVTAPVSPSKLVFGDIGQYTDHRVMALGDNKVWVNGQETPLEELETGPNFLGWERPSNPAGAAQPAVNTSATTPPTQK